MVVRALLVLVMVGCASSPPRARTSTAPEAPKPLPVAKAPASKPCPFVDPLLDPREIHRLNCMELQTDCSKMVVHEDSPKDETEPCP